MALFKKRGKWYIDYRYQGRRIRESIGTNKRQAKDALDARKGEIVQGRFKLQEVKSSLLFERLAEQYATWAETNKRGWRQTGRFNHKALLSYFSGKPLNAITTWLIEKYKLARRQQVKPATVNRDLSLLSHIFTKAIAWGDLTEHPMKGGKVKKLPGETMRERILAADEEAGLLAQASGTLRPIIILALDTGMRSGEILGLTWDHVDLRQGEILLTQTKNGRYRRIPLTDRALDILRAQTSTPAPSALVFTRGNAEPLRSVREAFLGARDRAKLSGLRFHDLRHTFATRLVTSGVDIVTVQRLLGHQTLAMTQRYAHPTSADMRKAIRALNALARDGHHMDTIDNRPQAVVAISAR